MVIADVLFQAGYSASVTPLIQRISPVQKSTFATAGQRPLVPAHKASLHVQIDLLHPEQITLIKDVMIKEATTAACAELLQESYPKATIRIFAVMRTLGFKPEIETVFDPVVGIFIRHPSDLTYRDP